MSIKRISILLLFLFADAYLFAQTSKVTISGFITNEESGEALIGATVYDLNSGKGSSANNYGFYSITLPADSILLRFSYVGFQNQLVSIKPEADYFLNIKMSGSTELQEVEISGTQLEDNFRRSQMSAIDVPMDKVESLPVLLGERDVVKTMQLFPGVQSGSEGSSGLYVRGGGPDQNLILLDGVPIYNANHLFGFFSVFNTDAINSVKLIKGGFPAEYGGRLSSVVDLRMKEGNSKKIHGEGGIGLISSRLTLEGPIIKDKTSFMISGRRTYIDVFTRPIIKNMEDIDAGYYFYDLNAKINHRFSEKSRLFLSGYFGKDKFYVRESFSNDEGEVDFQDRFESGLQWGNAIAALRWNYILSPKLFSNTTLTYSSYNFLVDNEYETRYRYAGQSSETFSRAEYNSGIEDYSAKVDFNYIPTPDHYIKFGGAFIHHTFNPGINRFVDQSIIAETDTSFGSGEIVAQEFYVYASDDFKFSERIKINLGFHFSGFLVNATNYYSLQPRFSGRFLLNELSSVKLSYAHMAQYLHLLTNSGVGLPTDLWVPPTEHIKPQLSHQIAAGYSRKISSAFQISIETYYKLMENLIEYKDGASFLSGASDWQSKVETGKGWSYGAELLLEKTTGKTTGWIGYTISRTDRQFEGLNFGNVFPYKYDRRHDISLVISHAFNERVDVGLVWVYGTGNAITLPTQRYRSLSNGTSFFGGNEIDYIQSRNNYRMAAYHRLDIGVNFHKKTKYGSRTWSFGLYNAYSRQNPFYLYFSRDDYGNQQLTQLSLFPILPSVNYNFKF